MWIVFGILAFLGIIVFISFLLAVPIAMNQEKAKKRANEIIESRQINDWKNFERICKVLSTITNDKEADYLYTKLMEIKEESKAT
jgi:hypothetical protein